MLLNASTNKSKWKGFKWTLLGHRSIGAIKVPESFRKFNSSLHQIVGDRKEKKNRKESQTKNTTVNMLIAASNRVTMNWIDRNRRNLDGTVRSYVTCVKDQMFGVKSVMRSSLKVHKFLSCKCTLWLKNEVENEIKIKINYCVDCFATVCKKL